MNRSKRLINQCGFVLCSALLGALSGCIGYVEQSRPRAEYAPPPPVYAPAPSVEVSFAIRTEADFYEPLTSYGRWEIVGNHGRCWIPGRVEADWRPYSNGHWQRTEAGWYWASEEPWAWATYHYGRWDLSADIGWYWVPQTQWAPAWVSWHSGGGHIGWAPLQPSVRIAAGGVVAVNVDLIAPRAFIFVEERRFLEPIRPTTVVVNNTTIINNTVNITNIKVVNNTVINEGPRTTVIEQVTAQKVQAVPVRELRHKEETEVVARQRTVPSAKENHVQPPVHSKTESSGKKEGPAHERRPVGKPAETTKEQLSPAAKSGVRELREQESAAKSVPPQGRLPARNETRPEVVRPTKPAAEPVAEVKKSKPPNPVKQAETPLISSKEKAAANKPDEKNKKKKDDKKKGKAPETPPEKPAVPQ